MNINHRYVITLGNYIFLLQVYLDMCVWNLSEEYIIAIYTCRERTWMWNIE